MYYILQKLLISLNGFFFYTSTVAGMQKDKEGQEVMMTRRSRRRSSTMRRLGFWLLHHGWHWCHIFVALVQLLLHHYWCCFLVLCCGCWYYAGAIVFLLVALVPLFLVGTGTTHCFYVVGASIIIFGTGAIVFMLFVPLLCFWC